MSACIGSPGGNPDALGFAATNGQRGPNSIYSVGGNGHAAAGHPTRSHNTQVVGESGSSSSYQPYVVVNYMIKAKSTNGVMVMSAQNAAVIDNCTSNSITDALSAHQGKTLMNKINGLLPVELYKNASGSSGTITLTDSVANYDYIEIYVLSTSDSGTGYAQNCTKVWQPNGKTAFLTSGYCDANSFNLKMTSALLSGTSITRPYGYWEFNDSSASKTNYVGITKVLGYKLV